MEFWNGGMLHSEYFTIPTFHYSILRASLIELKSLIINSFGVWVLLAYLVAVDITSKLLLKVVKTPAQGNFRSRTFKGYGVVTGGKSLIMRQE